ncbi:F-box protein At5g49610-like [Solanum stenotomum]|uniref:F-box protein At5g49610-like n=1 Tax=Solanum stenotomum TaxID=172797 RepID=UPI0020D1A83E|nr:F-box protein At5g49610-like [Solanum stenotomum]
MTTSMEQSSSEPVLELCEDNLIEILHRLPSKSLSRFESVCKHWGKCIDDPSIAYSCRSQRWSPQPYMMGFFCQGRDEVDEQNRFFFSSKKSSQMIDGSLDESVNFLGRGVHIMASSNGFLLVTEDLYNQNVYYVYNPATRQHFVVPVTLTSYVSLAIIGFDCKVDDPEKDVISFTIVRYEAWTGPSGGSTIESFSSETNMWTSIDLRQAAPIRAPLRRWTRSGSVGVIDGVFVWKFDPDSHIILYDSVYRRFWDLKLTDEMDDWSGSAVGVSDGVLYYALCNRGEITLWYLESNIRSTNDAVWVTKYVVNISNALLNCPEAIGSKAIGSIRIKMFNIDIHSVNPHIFYLLAGDKVISYDSEKNTVEFLYEIGVSVWTANQDYLFFSYEWHQWPRLLRTHQLEEE